MNLSKTEFRDSLRLRYNIPLQNIPRNGPCGKTFSVDHALCCKKGSFISARLDKLRNLLAGLLTRVCNNVEVEPQLTKIDNEVFRLQTTSTEDDARLDIKASDFWETGQTTFFDVRVTSHGTKATTEIFKSQENETKRKYLERIVEVENSSFTPLVFGTNGGMGKEFSIFLNQLAVKLSRNEDGNSYSTCINYLRTRLSFCILKSVTMCIRGTRTPFNSSSVCQESSLAEDFLLNSATADIAS